jgi:hypothetical protein
MSVVGSSPNTYPEEPENGIALDEEFTYEINVFEGIMYLAFTSEGHKIIKFTKNLLKSEFVKKSDIPKQILTLYASIGRDGTERENAYAGKIQYFKQGAYNQTNGKSQNIIWFGVQVLKYMMEILHNNMPMDPIPKCGLKKLL